MEDIMLFDTDIFIWIQRGNIKAAKLIEKTAERYLSIQSYMELLQGAKNKIQLRYTKDFLKDYNFEVLPLTENIGHKAAVYIEEYTISNGLRAGDAIIAATASENSLVVVTSNVKHLRIIADIRLKVFHPFTRR